jgi:hypothetical protein
MNSPVIKSPDIGRVRTELVGLCRKCLIHGKPVRHKCEGATPELMGKAAFDWMHRHQRCEQEHPGSVSFMSPRRRMPKNFDDRAYEAAGVGPQWMDWSENASITISYIEDAAITMDLSALGSSASWTAGRESTSVANTSNYLDCRISGKFISGTTPTAPAEARLYLVTPTEDTPAWPDVFDGTDSAETVTNTNILDSLPLIWSGTASATSNITYPIVNAMTLAQAVGFVPKAFVLFFAHAHTAALKTDAANTNSLFYQFIQAAVA